MLAELFGSRKQPLVGLDISSTSVKLIELGKVGNRYRVESFAVEPLPPEAVIERDIKDVEMVGEAIRRCIKRSGSSCKNAAVAVAGSAVITKTIQLDSGMPRSIRRNEKYHQQRNNADVPGLQQEVPHLHRCKRLPTRCSNNAGRKTPSILF